MQRDTHIGVEDLPSVANVAIRLSAYPYWQEYDDVAGQAIAVGFEEVHKRQRLDSDVGAVSGYWVEEMEPPVAVQYSM